MTPEQMQAILDDAQLKVIQAEIKAKRYEGALREIASFEWMNINVLAAIRQIARTALDAPEGRRS